MQHTTDEKPNSCGIVKCEQFYIAGDLYAAYEYLKGKLGTDLHPTTAARIGVDYNKYPRSPTNSFSDTVVEPTVEPVVEPIDE